MASNTNIAALPGVRVFSYYFWIQLLLLVLVWHPPTFAEAVDTHLASLSVNIFSHTPSQNSFDTPLETTAFSYCLTQMHLLYSI